MKSRRRIGHPKAWDYADSESALQQDFVARRIGFRWPLCAAANLEGGLLLRVKLGGKRTSATRLLVANERPLDRDCRGRGRRGRWHRQRARGAYPAGPRRQQGTVVDRALALAEPTVTMIETNGGTAVAHAADLTNEKQASSMDR